MRKTLGDFKGFILRGNVVDLAVAVVVGAAFSGLVTSFKDDFINPLIGLVLPGGDAFDQRKITIGTEGEWPYAVFLWGHFIGVVINFILVAAVVFFFVVRPINKLLSMRKTTTDSETTTRECPECLSSIPVKASRCAFCTAKVGAAPVE